MPNSRCYGRTLFAGRRGGLLEMHSHRQHQHRQHQHRQHQHHQHQRRQHQHQRRQHRCKVRKEKLIPRIGMRKRKTSWTIVLPRSGKRPRRGLEERRNLYQYRRGILSQKHNLRTKWIPSLNIDSNSSAPHTGRRGRMYRRSVTTAISAPS